jgi:ketosteroid isomerase-like protein
MELTPREVATAFSGHRFEEALPYVADDVDWRMPGSDGLRGADAVIAACRDTASALADTDVQVQRFVVIADGDTVAVDTLTVYRDRDGATAVASCDVYEFIGGLIVRITSYTVEV